MNIFVSLVVLFSLNFHVGSDKGLYINNYFLFLFNIVSPFRFPLIDWGKKSFYIYVVYGLCGRKKFRRKCSNTMFRENLKTKPQIEISDFNSQINILILFV